jgi:hypothetical protein
VSISRLSRPARPEVTALVVAALVLFLPWRRAPRNGVLVGGFLFFGGVKAAGSRHDLSHTGHPGVLVGTWIEAVAVLAGTAALTVRNCPARSC